MKYDTPELTALTPAINAIQSGDKGDSGSTDSPATNPPKELIGAYADWE
jgi:hypothetical protein